VRRRDESSKGLPPGLKLRGVKAAYGIEAGEHHLDLDGPREVETPVGSRRSANFVRTRAPCPDVSSPSCERPRSPRRNAWLRQLANRAAPASASRRQADSSVTAVNRPTAGSPVRRAAAGPALVDNRPAILRPTARSGRAARYRHRSHLASVPGRRCFDRTLGLVSTFAALDRTRATRRPRLSRRGGGSHRP
jgi:hypothetical protein